VSVEPFHLFRCLDQQAFLFNNRKDADGELLNDGDRFVIVVRQIVGKRLTYKQLTGKEGVREETFPGRKLFGRDGGSVFPLRFWTAPVGVER
jgi:hypothetical protein